MMKSLPYLALSSVLALSLTACGPSESQSQMSQNQTYFGATFDDTLSSAIKRVEAQMALPLTIPVPKDAGGGYTHEKHKENAKLIYDSGKLYELTGEVKYAEFTGKILSAYAEVYPQWGMHPAPKEQSPGRMFWQNLNESWWLVHAIQGYGSVKDVLSQEQRDQVETDLLRNMADFLSKGSPETFNKVHNHGTWATAAVGMTGYVIGDKDYTEQALLGLDKSGTGGFLKQLDVLFSPDGYYNEGPYYQRYALMPFVLFGQAIEANEPERKIFERRDEILKKAIYTTIQQSYGGLFFPINDALKDKGIATAELLYGVSIAYDLTGDDELLSVAEAQGKFVLTPESRAVSDALKAGKAKPFNYRSMRLSDGPKGDAGALDILRSSSDPKAQAVVMKNTSQGLGHGHFDKMGFLYYNDGKEILRDYGAARFLNVEAKYGGHYLAENNAFAKQTIAHNALVVDETSHFDGITATGNKYHPKLGTFTLKDGFQISSAEIDTAYPDVKLRRTMAMVEDKAFAQPIVIDVMEAVSSNAHQYDLPFYYNGHLIETNFKLAADKTSRKPLGTQNGYQYLWHAATAKPVDGLSQMTWLLDNDFYTLSSSVPENSDILFAQIGANDPNFNLRNEPAIILRSSQDNGASFVSVIEPHGEYNPIVEYTVNSHSNVALIDSVEEGDSRVVLITTKQGDKIALGLSQDMNPSAEHEMRVDGAIVRWTGPYQIFNSKKHLDHMHAAGKK